MDTLGTVWRLLVLLAGLVLLALPSGVRKGVFRAAARVPSHPLARLPQEEGIETARLKLMRLYRLEAEKLRVEEARLRLRDFRTLLLPQLKTQEDAWSHAVITGARFGPGGDLYLVGLDGRGGVHRGCGVVKGSVAFGTVSDVSDGSAWVLPLDVPPARVPVVVSRSRAEGLLEATSEGLFLRYVRAVESDPPALAEGDVLLTSGRAGMFPMGIVAGTVKGGVGRTADGLHFEAQVDAEFRHLPGDVLAVVVREETG